jgi:S-adenosylmethionine decarboxylase
MKKMPLPFAPGMHLLIDFWGASHLADAAYIEQALGRAAAACGATVLAIHLHSFGENAGVTGVAMLAESHISIHTWPELGYVALDVFMCGKSDPHLAVPVLHAFFKPAGMKVTESARGTEMSPAPDFVSP